LAIYQHGQKGGDKQYWEQWQRPWGTLQSVTSCGIRTGRQPGEHRTRSMHSSRSQKDINLPLLDDAIEMLANITSRSRV
jgi:hypothetical protein